MYKSPIEIIQDKIQTEYENGILRAVQKCDIHCNKEELIKALAYDRDQYRKGYEDAKPRWIPCSERLPKENGRYLCTNDTWGKFEVDWNAWVDGQWLFANENPIAWMPLPEPYTESEVES